MKLTSMCFKTGLGFVFSVGVLGLLGFYFHSGRSFSVESLPPPWEEAREELTRHLLAQRWPKSLELNRGRKCELNFTLRSDLQEEVSQLLGGYQPPFGGIVVMGAKSGEIRALYSHQKGVPLGQGMAWSLEPRWLAASLFKLVTAAAALERAEMSPYSKIWFNGGNHTLYRRHVQEVSFDRWVRHASLADAFAHSWNTPFARIAQQHISPEHMAEQGKKLGFNRWIVSDLLLPLGEFQVPEDPQSFAYAELASGFNRSTRTSALHAAMMASAVINDGKIPTPHVVREWECDGEKYVSPFLDQVWSQAFSPKTAQSTRILMVKTVQEGTSRRFFRRSQRIFEWAQIEVGGKTGSLSQHDPEGKLDWFMGYAQKENEEPIALGVFLLHGKHWTVKASEVARQVIERYYQLPSLRLGRNDRIRRSRASGFVNDEKRSSVVSNLDEL